TLCEQSRQAYPTSTGGREATPLAALSGSQRKAPGSAGGYLLFGGLLPTLRLQPGIGSRVRYPNNEPRTVIWAPRPHYLINLRSRVGSKVNRDNRSSTRLL